MVLVKLCKREETSVFVKTTAEELRLFSTQEKAEAWLRVNGFIYRPRTFFKGDPLCWCHENEAAWQYVDVSFQELDVDSEAEFNGMERIPAPWSEEDTSPWSEASRNQ